MGNRRHRHIIAGLAAAALLLAAPAAQGKPRAYMSGVYAGKVHQTIPHSATGTIEFRIHGHKLTLLRFTVTMVCAKQLITTVQSPPLSFTIKVGRDGRFAYAGTVRGSKVMLRGTARGHRAHGKFFESLRLGRGSSCTMLSAARFGTGVRGPSAGSGVTAPAATGTTAPTGTPAPAATQASAPGSGDGVTPSSGSTGVPPAPVGNA